MRRIILIFVISIPLFTYSQSLARSFTTKFCSLQFYEDKVILSEICNNDQFISCGEEYTGTYKIKKDTIELNLNGNKYYMYKKSNGVIVSLSSFFHLIKKNETLYAKRYIYSNGNFMMIGWEWKNGGKHGRWLFFDENGVSSGLIFEEGKIVGTYIPEVIDEGEE